MPKVSVIIPIYNVEKYLRQCLDSVVNQTLKDIEIICINDGSVDNSLKILEEYAQKDNRIVVINQANSGCDKARQNGLNIAKGEYIALLDSDDYISPDYYEELYRCAKKYYADVASTDQVLVIENEKKFIKYCGINKKDKLLKSIKQKANLIIATGLLWNKIYKRSFINKNKISFSPINIAAGDNYFMDIAIVSANRIAINHKAKYYYIIHNDSLTQKLKTRKDFQVIELYNLIKTKICEKVPLKDKEKWENIINQRKINDYNSYYTTLSPELKDEFKNKAFNDLSSDLIISLTSCPNRINTVHLAIKSILNQSYQAKVILYLADSEFPNREKELPIELLNLLDKYVNFEIRYCSNLKSYKKLIPALIDFPDSIHITIDDDILYQKNMISELYKAYLKNSNYIHCHRAHHLIFKNRKEIMPYSKWAWEISKVKPSFNNFCTSGAGTLFPPHCFSDEVLNEKMFTKLSPFADDIWFWAMAVKNNVKINVIKNNMSNLNYIKDTQKITLSNINQFKNDEQLNNVLNAYPDILKKLEYTKKLHKNYTWKNIFNNAHKTFPYNELLINPTDKILIIAPHPDDESIGCGGFLIQYASQCDVIVLTDGGLGNKNYIKEDMIEIRKKEFENAMNFIGIKNFENFNIPDKSLYKHLKIFNKLNLKKYDYVFVPNKYETHIDHHVIYKKVKSLLRFSKTKLVSYEVWSTLINPTSYVDISDIIEQKQDLINKNYPSQLEDINYTERIIGLNKYRGMQCRKMYAEAFNVEDLNQKFFSISLSTNKTHKIITILGLKIKLKRKNYA